MAFKVFKDGSFVDAKNIQVWDDGQFKQAQKVEVFEDGVFKQVWPTADQIDLSGIPTIIEGTNPSSAQAGYRINVDRTHEQRINLNFFDFTVFQILVFDSVSKRYLL